ncbi:GTPase-activating protein [Rhizina undulata]
MPCYLIDFKPCLLLFLTLARSIRPQTPTSGAPPSFASTPAHTSKPGKNYSAFISHTDDDWDADLNEETEEEILRGKFKPPKSIEYQPQLTSKLGGNNSMGDLGVRAPSYPNPPGRGRKDSQGLKPQFEGLVRDPGNSLHMIYHPTVSPDTHTEAEIERLNARISRINRFKRILQSSTIDLAELRKISWGGIPDELRPMAWQLLLGYLPANGDRRIATLERKRKEFIDGVKQAFVRGTGGLDQTIWHQISIDVPRTNPHIPLYGFETTQRCLERILYVWAIRHPASGYVQGINDLVTPFFQVFLSAYIDGEVETFNPGSLPKEVMDVVEADSFWCLTKLLDGIQDNYIHTQPGIQRQVSALRELVQRIDAPLTKHLGEHGVEFIQFSFRWMNCMLMREISVKNTIRMWDTYMAEGHLGFSEFHLYVCAAFLVKWSEQLQKMDFQEIMMFLQALPTQSWGDKEMEILLSEAYLWQSLFRNSSAHLRQYGSPMPSPLELLTLHNAFHQGQYPAVTAFPLTTLSPENAIPARTLVYRARIASGEAAAVLSELENENPAEPELKAVKALALHELGKTADAAGLVEELLQEVGEGERSGGLLVLVGILLVREGRLEEALGVLKAHEGVLEAVALMVQIRLLQNRTDLALKEVQIAKKWAQDSLLVNLAESWVSLRIGGDKYQQAYYVFEELAQAPATSAVATLIGQAVSEMHLGRLPEAEVALQQALEKGPGNAEALANSVVLAVLAGRESAELVEQLKAVQPKHQFLLDLEAKDEAFEKAAAKYSPRIGA